MSNQPAIFRTLCTELSCSVPNFITEFETEIAEPHRKPHKANFAFFESFCKNTSEEVVLEL